MNDSGIIAECQRLVPLGFWLEIAEQIHLPHVPAEFSQAFPVNQIVKALDDEETPALGNAFSWLKQRQNELLQQKKRFSSRWECCSSVDAKYAASKGMEWGSSYYRLMVDDPRVLDCTVGLETRLCVRPWIDAVKHKGYPVEFRVFFGPEGYLGISDYYPQRGGLDDLGNNDLAYAIGTAMVFGVAVERSQEFPLGFTLDFILRKNEYAFGELLLLEGGPPHIEHTFAPSAHPCCFAPGQITGIALEPMPGALKG